MGCLLDYHERYLWQTAWCINNNLFMGFDQEDAKVQNYDYRLVYSNTQKDGLPVLYVCAKKSSLSSATPFGVFKYQAFDITPFLEKYADANNKFSFLLQFKMSVDENNESVFRSLPLGGLTNHRFGGS
jgi:hypothetical protein